MEVFFVMKMKGKFCHIILVIYQTLKLNYTLESRISSLKIRLDIYKKYNKK